jgi:hypothetical protein
VIGVFQEGTTPTCLKNESDARKKNPNLQWRKHIVAIQKCTPTVDHAGSQL